MSLQLDDIKNFQTVSSLLNMTRASEVLGLSQPALSYSIKRLEKEIDAKLFIRQKNGVQLTKIGEEFLKKSNQLLHLWHDSQNIFSGESEKIKGDFSIGAHPSVAIYSLQSFFSNISKRFPLLNFHIINAPSREITAEIISWKIDFGIVINPTPHPDLVIKQLGQDIVTWFSTKKSLKKAIYNPLMIMSRKVLTKTGFEYDSEVKTRSLELIANLTANGQGYGLLPTRVANNHKSLKPVINAPSFKDQICLVYRKDKQQNIVSKEVIETLKDLKI